MSKVFNIAIVGLGQIGSYLLNELNQKKKIFKIKQEKKLILLLFLPKTRTRKDPSR